MLSGAGSDGTGGLQRLHSAFPLKIAQSKPAQTLQRASALPKRANSTEEKRTNSRALQAHLEISETAPVPVVCEPSWTWKGLGTQSQRLLQDWGDQEIISLLFVWVLSEWVLTRPLTLSWNPNTEMKWKVKVIRHLWSHPYLPELYCKNFTFYTILLLIFWAVYPSLNCQHLSFLLLNPFFILKPSPQFLSFHFWDLLPFPEYCPLSTSSLFHIFLFTQPAAVPAPF